MKIEACSWNLIMFLVANWEKHCIVSTCFEVLKEWKKGICRNAGSQDYAIVVK